MHFSTPYGWKDMAIKNGEIARSAVIIVKIQELIESELWKIKNHFNDENQNNRELRVVTEEQKKKKFMST